jgi:hypothetical protein
MQIYIGLDDTDNADSRGTGHLARQLAASLAEAGLAEPTGVTRHQLLVCPLIPYTSHNSAACITARVSDTDLDRTAAHCRTFLLAHSAPGADAGLCLAGQDTVSAEVVAFGEGAKQRVLAVEEAWELASRCGLLLEGLTGTRLGVIGALAGVGLCQGGEDGRFLWLPGLRELAGIHPAAALRDQLCLGSIRTLQGTEVPAAELVELGSWPRPLLRGGEAVLFVEEATSDEHCQWRVLAKEPLKHLSA